MDQSSKTFRVSPIRFFIGVIFVLASIGIYYFPSVYWKIFGMIMILFSAWITLSTFFIKLVINRQYFLAHNLFTLFFRTEKISWTEVQKIEVAQQSAFNVKYESPKDYRVLLFTLKNGERIEVPVYVFDKVKEITEAVELYSGQKIEKMKEYLSPPSKPKQKKDFWYYLPVMVGAVLILFMFVLIFITSGSPDNIIVRWYPLIAVVAIYFSHYLRRKHIEPPPQN